MRSLANSDADTRRERTMKASNGLLELLRKHHGEYESLPVEPEEVEEAVAEVIVAAISPEVIPVPEAPTAPEIVFPQNPVTVIQRAVLAEFPKVKMSDLRSESRLGHIVRVRQLAMYLARTLTDRSFQDIGRRFGGRDHSTIYHAVQKIEGKLASDPELAALVQRIKDRL